MLFRSVMLLFGKIALEVVVAVRVEQTQPREVAFHAQLFRGGGQQQQGRNAFGERGNRRVGWTRRRRAPGQVVRLVVRTNVGARIHVHGYNVESAVRKPGPTVIRFVAKLPGRFEVEMHGPDVLLAQLTVR